MDKLVLKPINDLLNESFFIPSYQRGYRWKENQVIDLLNDIWNFRLNNENENKEVFYCLQPVVVSKRISQDGKIEWELIDGQQRLTTISIIMQYLKKQLDAFDKSRYFIHYETREDSKDFIKNLNEDCLSRKEENIDYFHICEAFVAVKKWFDSKDGSVKIHFLTTLLNNNEIGKNVKVIWYDVSEENTSNKYAIDIFTRLNIGKIPLTNAELVKALFLMKSNFAQESTLKQIQIATEWDIIEKKLQDDSFWYFIYSPNNTIKYENRIEYIFDLLKNKKKENEYYHTFNQFSIQFEKNKLEYGNRKTDEIWLEIKQYFQTLEEWFSDRDLYHLIGFLIEYKINIDEIKNQSINITKTAFKEYLKSLIVKQLANIDIEKLDYYSNKEQIKKILLLFNIQTILSTQKADIRFPFNKYKKEKWDIEHVNSQTERNIEVKNRKKWAIDLLEFFTGINGYSNEIIDAIENVSKSDLHKIFIDQLSNEDKHKEFCKKLIFIIESEKVEDEYFNNLFEEIKKEYKEQDIKDKDGISNLALLDETTNRSYGNAIFPIKRRRIIENDRSGLFVPICTKNLFLKYYSKKLKEVMFWQQIDADDYKSAIKETLEQYLS